MPLSMVAPKATIIHVRKIEKLRFKIPATNNEIILTVKMLAITICPKRRIIISIV